MRSSQLLFAGLVLTIGAAGAAAQPSGQTPQDRALAAVERVHGARNAARNGGDAACLSYVVEEETAAHVDVAVRERHGEGCPGDPATSPVRDRYRVFTRGGRIQRYDPVNGDYVDTRR